jgi:hypothetical protein
MLMLIGQGGSVQKKIKNMKQIILVAKFDNEH